MRTPKRRFLSEVKTVSYYGSVDPLIPPPGHLFGILQLFHPWGGAFIILVSIKARYIMFVVLRWLGWIF